MSRKVNLGQIVPNIQIAETITTASGSSANVENIGTSLNPILRFSIPRGDAGQIRFIIVNVLPSENIDESAIYLLKITPDTQGNNYAEYIYINNNWELLGRIGVSVEIESITNQEIDTMWV